MPPTPCASFVFPSSLEGAVGCFFPRLKSAVVPCFGESPAPLGPNGSQHHNRACAGCYHTLKKRKHAKLKTFFFFRILKLSPKCTTFLEYCAFFGSSSSLVYKSWQQATYKARWRQYQTSSALRVAAKSSLRRHNFTTSSLDSNQ